MKAFHVLLKDFKNPQVARQYDIGLDFLDANDNVTEQYVGQMDVLASIQPSINVTSLLTDSGLVNPNTIYQSTTPGSAVPLPYDFYMWDGSGDPLTGVGIVPEGNSLLLKSGADTVGSVSLVTPPGGEDAMITSGEIFNDPIPSFLIGVDTGRFRANFQAGSVLGDYEVTFSLDGGNSVTMFTNVVPEPSAASLLFISLVSMLAIRRRGVGRRA